MAGSCSGLARSPTLGQITPDKTKELIEKAETDLLELLSTKAKPSEDDIKKARKK